MNAFQPLHGLPVDALLRGLPLLLGAFAITCATRWGPQLFTDSSPYLQAAQNLRMGLGLIDGSPAAPEPFTHYPPLFPTVIAGLELTGLDGLSAIRLLNGALFVVLIGLVSIAVGLSVGGRWAPVWGGFLALTSIDLLRVHTLAGSEPVFLATELASLILLSRYLQRPRLAYLVGSALLISLAVLDRYTGIVLIATGALALIWRGHALRARLMRDIILFVAISFVPISAWLLHGALLTGSVADRSIAYHPVTVDRLLSGFTTVWAWVLPFLYTVFDRYAWSVRPVMAALAVLNVAVVVGVALFFRRAHTRELVLDRTDPLVFLSAIFTGVYAPFLLFSASFLENTPFDWRLLSPVCVLWIVAVTALAVRVRRGLLVNAPRTVRFGASIVVAAFVAGYAVSSCIWIFNSFRDGRGYASRAWRESPTLAATLDQMAQNRWVVTNADDAIYLLAGQMVDELPQKFDPFTFRANPQYAAEMASLKQRLQTDGGLVVWFDAITWRDYLPDQRELQDELGVQPLQSDVDGTIYTSPAPLR